LTERKNGIERKMKAMRDLCTQLWSNLFLLVNFAKKRNQISKIQKSSSFGGFWSPQV
jgi:hypothetical protein